MINLTGNEMNLLVLVRSHPREQFDLQPARFRSDSPAHHRKAAAYPAACAALAAPSSSTWTRSAPRRPVAGVCPRTARSSGTPAPTSPAPAAPPSRSAAGGPRSCCCSPAPSATPSRRTTARKRETRRGSFSELAVLSYGEEGAGSWRLVTSVISPERRVRCRAESALGRRPEVRRGLPQTLTSSATDLYIVQRQWNTC